ncbi:MAG TPA: DUF3052 family protein, partial [Polyangiaceae bacterium]|nr:DUF3052 family protein [Polyangiaceae bacterium]
SELGLETIDGRLTLVLGAATRTWARKVQAPPSRLKKLGVGAEQRIALVGMDDRAFLVELDAAQVRVVTRGKAALLFFGVGSTGDLERLGDLRKRIEPDGAIWIVRVKGKAASVKENEVREAARAAGLVDVKVASFSDTHTAEKLVIPVADRAPSAPTPAANASEKTVAPRQKTGKRERRKGGKDS